MRRNIQCIQYNTYRKELGEKVELEGEDEGVMRNVQCTIHTYEYRKELGEKVELNGRQGRKRIS